MPDKRNKKDVTKPSPRIQLFCIPFAGGSSSSFYELCSYLDEAIECHVVEYPGRGVRSKEEYYTDIDQLIQDIKGQIITHRRHEVPYALFGYSMGTAICYDLIQYALKEKPLYAFMSARDALNLYSKSQTFAALGKERFVEEIKKLGGIDDRILNNRRFLEIYLEPIYADYKLWRQYKYKEELGIIDCDVTVFYSEQDTPYERVEGWKKLTAGEVDFYEFGNNHFFIKEHAQEMGAIINKKLLSIS